VQYIKTFELLHSKDGQTWTNIGLVSTTLGHVTKELGTPVDARYVKFLVKTFHGHVSMRAGVLLCKQCSSERLVDPAESSRSYSSTFYNDPVGTGHARSRLSSVQAWSPFDVSSAWMEIVLDSPRELIGVKVLPRKDQDQYVTKLRLELSTDGHTYADGGEYESPTGSFNAYHDGDGLPVLAKYVKLFPLTWHGHPSMRAGLLLCDE